MSAYTIDYKKILTSLTHHQPDHLHKRLAEALSDRWCAQYRLMTPSPTYILEFEVDSFTYLFDLASGHDDFDPDQAVEDRVVAAYGLSQAEVGERDHNRQRGFIGPSERVFGKNYDKGHFISHGAGGGLDVNLFPQRRDVNRGWSARGKIYRSMERYCAEHPGTFFFSRPIYQELSWQPARLEFGVLKDKGQFWVECFDN